MRAEDECIFSIKEVRGFNFASNVIYSQFKIILINATKFMRMHVVLKGIVELKGAATANMKWPSKQKLIRLIRDFSF